MSLIKNGLFAARIPALTLKAAGLAALGLGCAAMASASTMGEERIRVEFTYSEDAPANEIYAGFRRTAREACAQTSIPNIMRIRDREDRKCQTGLLDSAVQKTGLPALIALHEQRTGDKVSARQLASR